MYIALCVGGPTVEQLERETGIDDSQLETMIGEENVSDRISGFAGSNSQVSVNTCVNL